MIYQSFQLWWLSLIVGSSISMLLAGRFMSGLAAGGVFVLVPLYISEIAEDKIRGVLGSFFILSINVGTLLMFIAGSYLSYSLVPRIMISLPIVFALTFVFLPETPQHLLKHGKTKEAENSLKFLRGCRVEVPLEVKNELMEMSKRIEDVSNNKTESIWRELSNTTWEVTVKSIKFILFSFRLSCGDESCDDWIGSCVSKSALRLLCLYQLHSRNFHGIWVKSFAKYVSNYCGNHSSCRINFIHFCHRQLFAKNALRTHVLWHDCRTACNGSSWILKNIL